MITGLDQMFTGKAYSPATEIAKAITETETTIELKDGSNVMSGPNIACLGTGADGETIYYAQKDGDTLCGVTRGFEGAAKAWSAGTKVARLFTNRDYSALIANVHKIKHYLEQNYLYVDGDGVLTFATKIDNQ